MPKVDTTILEMAIVGYQSEVERISAKIADIKAQLGQHGPGRPKTTAGAPASASAAEPAVPAKRRTMSAAGRARISAAQRARWAAQKKQQAQPAKGSPSREAQEAEDVGGGIEGDQGSDVQALGGFPEGQRRAGVGLAGPKRLALAVRDWQIAPTGDSPRSPIPIVSLPTTITAEVTGRLWWWLMPLPDWVLEVLENLPTELHNFQNILI